VDFMSIIERIIQIMDTKDLNQTELCKYLRIRDSTFSNWKVRGTDPPAKYILPICEFLNVPTDYLLGNAENKNEYSINTGDISGNHNANMNINSPNHKNQIKLDEMSTELVKRFNTLSFDEKLDVFNYIKDKKSMILQ